MLLIDPAGVVADVNAACRELLGLDAAGAAGNHVTRLLARLAPRTEGDLLPPDGLARARFPGPGGAPYRDLATADLRAAAGECRYRSARYGPVRLRASEVPAVDPESGTCAGSVVTLEVDDPAALAAFRPALDRRLGHEAMWEVYAASYDHIQSELPFYREVVDRHCAAMDRPDVAAVLDLGAGTGSVAVRLLRAGKRVTAVDVGRAMLARLRAKAGAVPAGRLTVIEDTAEHLPDLPDGAFDGVTVVLAFFDMDDPPAAFREARRLLKPGGVLAVTEPRQCFDVARLMAAAEAALRDRGVLGRLAADWDRIRAVAPLVRDAVREVADRRAAATGSQDWHAEALYDALRQDGYTGLTFRESHLGNCATVTGVKP
jgi:ubiquinone/menaquinone biosynthesis C-methylase UbiE